VVTVHHVLLSFLGVIWERIKKLRGTGYDGYIFLNYNFFQKKIGTLLALSFIFDSNQERHLQHPLGMPFLVSLPGVEKAF